MHVLNIRNIEDSTFNSIKKESKKKGISINKLILDVLNKVFNTKIQTEHHDLDDFFGTWSDEDYNIIMETSRGMRNINDELWK
ncbi:MAG: hypothetical protein JXB88_09755 [Spirochaetales bacterium]|nr:hypothetical protein [Spirochaetales bacterium]